MRKRMLKWLLALTLFAGSLGIGATEYGYAYDISEIINSEQPILTEEDDIIAHVNQGLMNHEDLIVIKTYSEEHKPEELVKLVSMSDMYYDLTNGTSLKYCLDDKFIYFIVDTEYITTDEQNDKFEQALDAIIESLDLEGKTDYEKVLVIHDYICDNVDYDYEHYNSGENYMMMYSAYAALFDGKAVCQGYAGLFYRMCCEAGVSTKIIAGSGNGQRHAWNIVKLGDEYFNIDVTWDGQDEETYHDYFLMNENDFTYHTRDSQYRTEEYYKKYPMALCSWMDLNEVSNAARLNMDNIGTVTFNTVDGKTVTNQAVNKPKIIVYGDAKNCQNFSTTAVSLVNANFKDIDIIFVDCNNNTLETVKEFEEKNIGGVYPVVYGVEEQAVESSFWSYVHKAIGPYNEVYPPLVVYIDEDNRLQYAELKGVFTAEHVKEIIYTYIEGNKPFTLSEKSMELTIGDKKEIKATVNGVVKNSQFFKWTSLDSSIAIVDDNGKVSAVGKGKTSIVCKVNDDVSLECEIVVKGLIADITDGLNKDVDGIWRYYKDGEVNISYTGLVNNKYGWWYVKNGKIDFTYTGL